MTLNDPIWQQNATYSASEFRDVMETFPGTGALNDGDLKVTQRGAGANMSVDVAAGQCVIPNAVASRGKYLCRSTAVENVTIAAAPGVGNSRIDLITAKVLDTEYGDGSNSWQIVAITGTAGGSPSAPALPAGSILLATIAVGSGVASISNANITDGRAYARTVTYTDRLPSTAVNGQVVVSSAGVITTRSAGAWKTAAHPSQFGAIVATMGTTTLPGTQTGYCTATLPQPTGPVTVVAQFNGGLIASTGSNAIAEIKMQISFDGGTTWTDGGSAGTLFFITANAVDFQACAVGYAAQGTPSGTIKARIFARRTGTPQPDLAGHLVLSITPG
jgi:hypothetical protein